MSLERNPAPTWPSVAYQTSTEAPQLNGATQTGKTAIHASTTANGRKHCATMLVPDETLTAGGLPAAKATLRDALATKLRED